MTDKLFQRQEQCRTLAAILVSNAEHVYAETGAATLDQGTVEDWERIKKGIEEAGDVLNDLLNNLQTITGGPEGGA